MALIKLSSWFHAAAVLFVVLAALVVFNQQATVSPTTCTSTLPSRARLKVECHQHDSPVRIIRGVTSGAWQVSTPDFAVADRSIAAEDGPSAKADRAEMEGELEVHINAIERPWKQVQQVLKHSWLPGSKVTPALAASSMGSPCCLSLQWSSCCICILLRMRPHNFHQ